MDEPNEVSKEKKSRLCVLTVASRKGGVGKTTTAIQLGSGLSLKVAHNSVDAVVLIDGDFSGQGHIGRYLGIGQGGGFAAAVLGERPVLDCVLKIEGYSRLYAMRGDATTTALERMYVSSQGDIPLGQRLQEVLNELLDLVKGGNGLVVAVIDTGPGFSDIQTAALVVADYILVPVTPGVGGASGLSMMWKWYETLRQTNDQMKFGAIPVMFEEGRPEHRAILANISALQPEMGSRLYPVIPFSYELASALDSGITVWEDRRLQKGLVGIRYAEALKQLALQLGISLVIKKEGIKNDR